MINEYLKNLIKSGFKVYLIDIDSEVKIKENFKVDSPVEGSKPAKYKQKRINWKTIEKIKKLKAEGWTSQDAADDLKLPLELINKHWGE